MELYTTIVFFESGLPFKYRNVNNVSKLVQYLEKKKSKRVLYVNIYDKCRVFVNRIYFTKNVT